METEKYNQAMREMYRRIYGEMADTLKIYHDLKDVYDKLEDEFRAIKQEYPKYKPKKVKAQYDKLKLDLIHSSDKIKVCGHAMLIGVPLDEFNRVYEQAKSEVLDIFIRYETDPVLNVLMPEHVLSAYIRYCRATKELTYNIDLVYMEDEELPSNEKTDDYLEISLVDNRLISLTLSELHNKWKEDEPVEANLYRNFRYGTRNHSTIRAPWIIIQSITYWLYDLGDLPITTFIPLVKSIHDDILSQ